MKVEAVSRTTEPVTELATTDHAETDARTAAVIAGIGYAILFVFAIFANFVVREGLVVTDDAAATAANIADSQGLFRFGIVSFLVIFLVDVIVAWGLHIVFRRAHRDVSLLAAWFRIVYTVFLGAALIYFFQALQFLNGSSFQDAFDAAQREAHALAALDTFNSAWLIGLAAFGAHLIVLGTLIWRTRVAPRALGTVLIAAGTAYVIDTAAHSLLADYGDYETAFILMVAVPSVIAEGWMGLWLMFRAGKKLGVAGADRSR